MCLQQVNCYDRQNDGSKRNAGSHHHAPPCHGQTEDDGREQKEAQDEVEDGEPAVRCRLLSQEPGHADGQAGERQGVPQEDAQDIEEEVTQGDLGDKSGT